MLKHENEESGDKMKTKLIRKIMIVAITTMAVVGMSSIGASAAWRQDGHGWWNTKESGYSVGWENIGNNWFYFNQDGYMKTGWFQDGGKWYYLNPNGSMQTGWLHDGNKWYYLNKNGDMAYNAFIAGYRLGADGAWIGNDFDNGTTGAAVNVTTGPEIGITDSIGNNTTTDAAVTVPVNNANNYYGYLDNHNKVENLLNKYNKKLDEQAQKMQQRANRIWQYFYR